MLTTAIDTRDLGFSVSEYPLGSCHFKPLVFQRLEARLACSQEHKPASRLDGRR